MDISSISAVAAAIGVIVGVALTVLQLRDLVKTRQTDLVIRLYSSFGSKESTEAVTKILSLDFEDFNDFVKKYGSWRSRKPVHTAIIMVSNFFNEVGILLHRKLVDIGLVEDLFTYRVKVLWEILEPIAEGSRKQFNEPRWAWWFEYLYTEMKKREQTPQTQQSSFLSF